MGVEDLKEGKVLVRNGMGSGVEDSPLGVRGTKEGKGLGRKGMESGVGRVQKVGPCV